MDEVSHLFRNPSVCSDAQCVYYYNVCIRVTTNLNDLLHPRGADHVRVRVKADLIHDGPMTFQNHKSPVHHSTRTSCRDRERMSP